MFSQYRHFNSFQVNDGKHENKNHRFLDRVKKWRRGIQLKLPLINQNKVNCETRRVSRRKTKLLSYTKSIFLAVHRTLSQELLKETIRAEKLFVLILSNQNSIFPIKRTFIIVKSLKTKALRMPWGCDNEDKHLIVESRDELNLNCKIISRLTWMMKTFLRQKKGGEKGVKLNRFIQRKIVKAETLFI